MPAAKQKKTAADSIYDTLRSNIVELHIKPGTMISIKDLAEHMKVSRSPVRDALIRLEKEGLITTMPQYGTMVSKIDLERVSAEQFLRASLEEKNILLFAQCFTEKDILKLRSVLAENRAIAHKADYRRFLEFDDTFHSIFFEATRKKFCWDTVQSVSGHYRRFRLISFVDEEISENVLAQHEQIIEYATQQNTEKLIATLQRHLTKIDQEKLDFARKYPDIFTGLDMPEEKDASLWDADFLQSLK